VRRDAQDVTGHYENPEYISQYWALPSTGGAPKQNPLLSAA